MLVLIYGWRRSARGRPRASQKGGEATRRTTSSVLDGAAVWYLVFLVLLVGSGWLLAGRPPKREAGIWGLGEVLGAITAVFLLTIAIAQGLALGRSDSLPDLTAAVLLQSGLTVGIVLYVVAIRYRLPLPSVGLVGRDPLRLAAVGIALGLVTIPISAIAETISIEIAGMVMGPAQAERLNELEHAAVPVERILQGPVSAGDIALIVILICGVVPLTEELFFRGFAFGTMRARWRRTTAILASAAFFAAVHLQLIHFLPILALGVVLAYAYDRTGSLVAPVMVHAVNNLVAILSTLYGWNL